MATVVNYLDQYLEGVTTVFTPELANRILALQPDRSTTERVSELGEKSNSGALTENEREEYEDLIDAGDLIALLKAKARRYLASQSG